MPRKPKAAAEVEEPKKLQPDTYSEFKEMAQKQNLPKKLNPKVEQLQENLRYTLQESDIAKLGTEQARALAEIDRAEEELKAFSTDIKSRIAHAEATVKGVSEKIRNGYEFRYIPVTITTDYENNLVTYQRDDTGEIYHSRPLNSQERQFKMDLESDMGVSTEMGLDEVFPPDENGPEPKL